MYAMPEDDRSTSMWMTLRSLEDPPAVRYRAAVMVPWNGMSCVNRICVLGSMTAGDDDEPTATDADASVAHRHHQTHNSTTSTSCPTVRTRITYSAAAQQSVRSMSTGDGKSESGNVSETNTIADQCVWRQETVTTAGLEDVLTSCQPIHQHVVTSIPWVSSRWHQHPYQHH